MQKSSLLNNTGQNPAQNISINISYNLNTNKIPKQILPNKKSTQKMKKPLPTTALHGIGNQFFNQLAFNSLEVKNKQRKENLHKKSNQSSIQNKQSLTKAPLKQVTKKKKNLPPSTINKQLQVPGQQQITQPAEVIPQFYNPLASNARHFLKRNIQSPDIFKAQIGKKMKTQGSMYDDGLTAGKKKRAISAKEHYGGLNNKTFKNSKINNFLKETINNGTIGGTKMALGSFKTIPKKNIANNKTPKSKQRNSLSSKPKRIHTQESQQFYSQTGSNPQYRHNKSCMLYSTKKQLPHQNIITEPHLLQTAENIMSQYASVNSTKARKRAQSAYIFGRKDKQLVSKLLNMSIISSELGSSQLITSERLRSGRNQITRKQLGLKVDQLDSYNKLKNVQDESLRAKKQAQSNKQEETVFPGNALRQYLNSIDLRIIKSIENDTANIVSKDEDQISKKEKVNNRMNFEKKQTGQFINAKAKQRDQEKQFMFSSKQAHKKSIKQEASSHQGHNTDVVSFYNKLFTNALQNKLLQQKEKYIESANESQYGEIHEEIKKERFIVNGFNQDQNLEENIDEKTNQKREKYKKQQTSNIDNIKNKHHERKQKYKEQQQEEDESSDNSDNQLYEFVNQKQSSTNKPSQSMKLNFQHYKQLLQSHKNQYNENKVMEDTQQINFQLMSCEMENSIKTEEIQKLNLQSQQSDGLESPLKYFQQANIQAWNQDKRQIQVNKIISENKKENFSLQIKQSLIPDKNETEIIVKSPKHSNRQKLSHLREPEYTEICWEYNEEQFQKELNSISNRQEINKKDGNLLQINRGLNSSPTNNSDFGSGDQEYDSKKYSLKDEDEKDKILQDQSIGNTAQKIIKSFNNQGYGITNPTTSLIEPDSDSLNEQQSISCEDREIGTAQRWVNPAFCQLKQSPQPNIKKQQNQQTQNDDYLECSLTNFGNFGTANNNNKVNVISQKVQKNKPELKQAEQGTQSEKNDQNNDNIPTIELKLSQIVNQTQQNQPLQVKPVDPFTQIRKKRLSHIIQDIILELIKQFAKDISYILKKSSNQKRTNTQFQENSSPLRVNANGQFLHQNELSPFSRDEEMFGLMGQQMLMDNSRVINNNIQQKNQPNNNLKRSQFVGKCFGIDTSFLSVQQYLKQFKQYVIKDQKIKQSIIKNINKDIGPNSLQILSYLRPEYDGMMMDGQQPENDFNQMMENSAQRQLQVNGNPQQQQEQQEDEQDGLFVVPSEAFSEFQSYLQQKLQQKNKTLQPQKQIILTQKQKRNTNFWHRGIYQSWNQFLDYQRPYGINGKPYEWIQQKKKYRQVKIQNIEEKLQRGIEKLLEAISLPSGIIYDKFQMSSIYMDLSQEQKMYLNEERLSRMLAIQLFESEETWINYNDEMAELLVQLSRVIEERVFFEVATEVKRVQRRRKFEGLRGSNQIENIIDDDEQNHCEQIKLVNGNMPVKMGQISEQQGNEQEQEQQDDLLEQSEDRRYLQ